MGNTELEEDQDLLEIGLAHAGNNDGTIRKIAYIALNDSKISLNISEAKKIANVLKIIIADMESEGGVQ